MYAFGEETAIPVWLEGDDLYKTCYQRAESPPLIFSMHCATSVTFHAPSFWCSSVDDAIMRNLRSHVRWRQLQILTASPLVTVAMHRSYDLESPLHEEGIGSSGRNRWWQDLRSTTNGGTGVFRWSRAMVGVFTGGCACWQRWRIMGKMDLKKKKKNLWCSLVFVI